MKHHRSPEQFPNRPRSRPRRRKGGTPQNAQQYFAKSERFQDTWNRVSHVIAKMRSDGLSLRRAAGEVGISPRTVRRWGKSAMRKNSKGRFVAKKSDRLLRVLMVPASDGPRDIAVRNSQQASLLGKYWAAVQKYLATGDASEVEKFQRKFIRDASGKRVPLLTDLDELNRLGSANVLSLESLYSRNG